MDGQVRKSIYRNSIVVKSFKSSSRILTGMSLNTIIDKIRINVFAEIGSAYVVYSLYMGIIDVVYQRSEIVGIIEISAGIGVLAMMPKTIRRQNERYDNLIKVIERSGYHERYCAMYMDHPCGRSVVKTVLERTKHSEKYNGLKKKYPLRRLW